MLRIDNTLAIPLHEIEWDAVRARGSGGQHVNKVSTAIHLRFDIAASSLPQEIKTRLLQSPDKRITDQGVVIIKAQRHRSQEKNRLEALERLRSLIEGATIQPKRRIATRPSRGARQRRLDDKGHRSRLKNLRRRIGD